MWKTERGNRPLFFHWEEECRKAWAKARETFRDGVSRTFPLEGGGVAQSPRSTPGTILKAAALGENDVTASEETARIPGLPHSQCEVCWSSRQALSSLGAPEVPCKTCE